jgi:hypothetical protein
MKKRLALLIGLMLLFVSSAGAALIAHLTFDDTLTNSVSSDYGAVSVGSGTPQYSADAKYGKSLLFTNPQGGANAVNKLNILDGGDWSSGSSSWTFSAWLKPTTLTGTTQDVFSAGSAAVPNYATYFDFRNGSINTYYNDDGVTAAQNAGTVAWGGAAGDWYRLTVVFDAASKTVKEYRDNNDELGGLVLLKTSAANYYTPTTLTNFMLGASSGGKYGFQGYMDDVRIYDTALSQSEVDVIPEPATIGLFGTAAGLLLLLRRLRG